MKRFAIRFNAPVVLSFAILSLLVLVLDSATGGASTARLFCVYRAPLTDPLTYVRFFTHVLGHSGYSHYMSNMLLLLLVGPGSWKDQPADRFRRCIRSTYGSPCIPESGCRGRSYKLPSDARNGPERCRCYRYSRSSRNIHGYFRCIIE